jgi:hypothetical protein
MATAELSRRTFLHSVAAVTAFSASGFSQESDGKPNENNEVQLSQIPGPSEQDEKAPGPFLPSDKRVGFAIVGLGRLSLDQILPAFGHSQYCKPVALVSGDRDKASEIAAQYGIAASASTTMRILISWQGTRKSKSFMLFCRTGCMKSM